MITVERLKSLLEYDPESGQFFWKVKRNQYSKIGEDGKYHFIGRFPTLDEADKAVSEARERLHKEFKRHG